jgi:superfamily II DNA or RNA helicase
MSKAVLSNRIYLEVNASQQEAINKELTYTIPAYNDQIEPLVIRNMGIVRQGLITIPIGRTDLIPQGHSIVEKRVLVPTTFPEFKFPLRASQQEVYDDLDDNAIINATVSYGKTFTALAIAGKLAQKTLVVSHTIPLMNQWVKETEKVYGFTPGIIGSGKYNDSMPITIGSVQSLYNNIPKISRKFGTVIMDEFHHVSSNTFSQVIDKNYARYKIGLSGTIFRKDGKHVVFRDYFGKKVYQPPAENAMTPEVHLIYTDIPFPDGAATPWAVRVNKLVSNDKYRHLIAMLSAKYAAQGHNVLMVSDRVAFIESVVNLIGPKAVSVTGTTKNEDRDALIQSIGKTHNVLGGTQSIFSEGMSHSPLSCLVLGTPVNNEPLLTQLIGRVVRLQDNKLQPIVVDIQLIGNTASRQALARLGHYIRQGYRIKKIWV